MAEGGGLENRCPVMNGTVGSNPTPSAISFLFFQPLAFSKYHGETTRLSLFPQFRLDCFQSIKVCISAGGSRVGVPHRCTYNGQGNALIEPLACPTVP